MTKTKEKAVASIFDEQEQQEGSATFENAKDFMLAEYSGTYVVPHPDRLDKKMEKRFRVVIPIPKNLLKNNMNFHSFFRNTQTDKFKELNSEFVRFKNIIFEFAKNFDGSEINDPRTYSLERLKKYCVDNGWDIDFHLYPGLKLRDIVFQYFLRPDKVDESKAFYKRQEQDRSLHGLEASLKAELASVPEAVRIEVKEI